MEKKDIELLLKNESYDEAIREIKKELRNNSKDAELFYYLFLAENKDYVNINPDDIVNEIDFNKALELATKNQRKQFDSEYNFFKAVDPNLRKYFAYAARGNVDKFNECIINYEYREAKLTRNGFKESEFLRNLEYLVTSRLQKEIVNMNLLSLNILYLSTKNEDVLRIFEELKKNPHSWHAEEVLRYKRIRKMIIGGESLPYEKKGAVKK